MWLRSKDTGEKLGVENIYDLIDKEIKGKFGTNNPTEEQTKEDKRHGSELISDAKFMYTHEDVITPIIMYCRVSTPKEIEFISRLRFDQYDIVLTKEQLVLKTVMEVFDGENMETQYIVLGYKIDLYFCDYRLAVEVDEKNYRDGDVNNEIERQEAINEKLKCSFIIINPNEQNFNILNAI